jgi:hypothetical protein
MNKDKGRKFSPKSQALKSFGNGFFASITTLPPLQIRKKKRVVEF